MVASGSADRSLKLWDVSTKTCLCTLTGHAGDVESVSFSPSGNMLASGSADRKVKLWEPRTGKLIRTLPGLAQQSIDVVAFSPDGKTLAVAGGSQDVVVKLVDVTTGRVVRTLTGHSSPVGTLAFSPDGQTVVTGSFDMTIRLWEASTGDLICELGRHESVYLHPGYVYAVAFSPLGDLVASGSDPTIKLWEVASRGTPCTGVTLSVQLIPSDPMIGEEVSLHGGVSGCEDCAVEWRFGSATNDVREATQVFYAPGSQPGLLVVTARNGCRSERQFTVNVSVDIANLWRDPNTLLRLVQHQEHRKTSEEILSYDTWSASRMDAILQRLYEDQAAIDEEQGGILGQIAMSITGALQGVTQALEEKIGWAIDFVSGAQDVVVGFSSDVAKTAKEALKQGMLADLAAGRGSPLTAEEKATVSGLFDATIGKMTDRLSTDVEDKIDEKFDELKARLELLRPSGQLSALASTLSANIPNYAAAFKGALLYGKMGLMGSLKQVGVSIGRDLGQAGFKGIIGKLAPMFFAMSINDISGVGDLSQQMNAARAQLSEAWREYSAVRTTTNRDLYTYKHILALPALWQPIMEAEKMMIRAYNSLPGVFQTEAIGVKRDKWELGASAAEAYIEQYLTIDKWLNGECGQVFLATYGRPELFGEVAMPLLWTSSHVEAAIRWLVSQW